MLAPSAAGADAEAPKRIVVREHLNLAVPKFNPSAACTLQSERQAAGRITQGVTHRHSGGIAGPGSSHQK